MVAPPVRKRSHHLPTLRSPPMPVLTPDVRTAILARALTLPPDPAASPLQANTHQHHACEHYAETAHLEDSPQAQTTLHA